MLCLNTLIDMRLTMLPFFRSSGRLNLVVETIAPRELPQCRAYSFKCNTQGRLAPACLKDGIEAPGRGLERPQGADCTGKRNGSGRIAGLIATVAFTFAMLSQPPASDRSLVCATHSYHIDKYS